MAGGRRERLRLRRGRCRSCRATHLLLPSWAVPRRADSAGVIAQAAALSVRHGAGSVRLGAQLGVPPGTVRGWLRRLRARAGQLLQEATARFGFLVVVIETPAGRDPGPAGADGLVRRRRAGRRRRAHAATRWHGACLIPGPSLVLAPLWSHATARPQQSPGTSLIGQATPARPAGGSRASPTGTSQRYETRLTAIPARSVASIYISGGSGA